MKEIILKKENTCCVTGHRTLYSDFDKDVLEKVFAKLIERGFCNFLIGMALGFDTECFKILEKFRSRLKHLKLIACVPCPEQAEKFNINQKREYVRMLDSADDTVVISDCYTKWCMHKRNEYMVDLADKIIAVWDGSNGGTANCVRYAEKKGKDIIRIVP